jgi:KDO2-lipid IV(A) lauroyltransferase
MIDFVYRFLSNRKLSTLHKIASFLGILTYYLVPSRRKVVIKNCQTIGIKPTASLVKNIYKEVFKSFFELFYVENIDEDFIKKYVICKNKEEILSFYKNNPELFILTGHMGAWELLGSVLYLCFNINGALVGRKVKNKKLDQLITRLRSAHGNIYITHKNALKEIVKCFSKNIPVGVLLDHSSMPKNAIFVEFFGVKTSFIAGAVTLAVKKNIPFKPFFLIRKEGKYELVHYPPIFPDNSLVLKERIYKMASDINKVYEDIILKYPEQWFMLHKRFKRNENENGEISNGFY